MLRCPPCRQVLGVYRGHEWAFIEEHLHDVLGKQSRDAGDLDSAVQHFAEMLPCRHSPEHWQAYYLKQFLEVVQQAALERVRALDVPLISCFGGWGGVLDCGVWLVWVAGHGL
jgi:hypothetical protein